MYVRYPELRVLDFVDQIHAALLSGELAVADRGIYDQYGAIVLIYEARKR